MSLKTNFNLKLVLGVLGVAFFHLGLSGPTSAQSSNCTLRVPITGAIGAGTLDLIERAFEKNKEHKCDSILLAVNTPGGNLQTTRMIVEKILASPVPVLCLITPSGGHAGSAGAIILQACHVSGGLDGTNIGAATPVAGTGQEIPKDLREKLVNDTSSFVEGLAEIRKRDKKFAKEIVTIAKAVTSTEAAKLRGIDWAGATETDFLKSSIGKKVQGPDSKELIVSVGAVKEVNEDIRYRILDLISDPQFAYLIFMGSLALLYFELTHPGAIVPGVLGAIGLVLSLIAFHKLQVQWGGLALMLLGIGFMIAEAFVVSFGALGIAGIISFIVGGMFLFDPEVSGVSLPFRFILITALTFGGIMLGVAYMLWQTTKAKKEAGTEDFIGSLAVVTNVDLISGLSANARYTGYLKLKSENWKYESERQVQPGDTVKVKSVEGLKLIVE
jgi:membrane-bound serine protease (ClpP class)